MTLINLVSHAETFLAGCVITGGLAMAAAYKLGYEPLFQRHGAEVSALHNRERKLRAEVSVVTDQLNTVTEQSDREHCRIADAVATFGWSRDDLDKIATGTTTAQELSERLVSSMTSTESEAPLLIWQGTIRDAAHIADAEVAEPLKLDRADTQTIPVVVVNEPAQAELEAVAA